MNTFDIVNVSRRELLKAGGGLSLAVIAPPVLSRPGGPDEGVVPSSPSGDFEPNAFVRIGLDDGVTVIVKHTEMGQGTYTGLPALVAEELDADWAQIRVEGAPADAGRYGNLAWGGDAQGTGASTSLSGSYEQLRNAGASARAMLVAAAAARWEVPPEEVSVERGIVSHRASGRSVRFGQLAAAASALPVPIEVKLKDPGDFRYVGKHVPRTDSAVKSNGKALYTQDVRLPGMLTAVVAHPPRFGGRVKSFDAGKAKAVSGVVEIVAVPQGVAVLARDFWSAKRGRDALAIEWDDTNALRLDSAELMAQYRTLAETPGAVARKDGEPEAALEAAPTTLEAEFEFPFLAHAAMEPMNCVIRLGDGECEVWNGEQFQTPDQQAVARVFGLEPRQVRINQLFAGGSFGRRANPCSDYLVECAEIVKAIDGRVPVKLVWTREDDTKAGYYRPMYFHALRAGLDDGGNVVAWRHRIVGQSILTGTSFEAMMVKDGIDHSSVEGAYSLPYAIANLGVDLHSPTVGVPVQWWRSVGSSHTAFSTETFFDELATAAGRDPYELRRELLAKHPRHLETLELAATNAGWSRPLEPGKGGERRGRGIALHESFGSVVANVAEATVRADGTYKVDRVVCAVHCGLAVNPDIVRAQMESGIVYGLTAAMHGAITLKDGVVEQSNFHDYPPLRMNEMPRIDVHIVPSSANPTGVGEPGTPVAAPALANALYAATGRRLRTLPFPRDPGNA